jgi:hypothetical protein
MARARGERIIFFSDVHIPHGDPKAWSILLQLIGEVKPTWLFCGGDFMDFYSISRFAQPGSSGPGFPMEVQLGVAALEELRAAAPRARFTYVEGNHEYRLKAWLNSKDGASFKGARFMSVPEQLDFKRLRIEWVECPGERWYTTRVEVAPNFYLGHFSKISQWPAYAAKGIQDRLGCSFITGHNHSGGITHRTQADGRIIWGYEGGCLCLPDPPYCEPTAWTQLIHVIHTGAHAPEVERVVIQDGRARYGGKVLKA